jgi:hypothetical protein
VLAGTAAVVRLVGALHATLLGKATAVAVEDIGSSRSRRQADPAGRDRGTPRDGSAHPVPGR